MVGNKNQLKIGTCCFLLLMIAFVSLVHVGVFELYDELSIYVVFGLLLLCLLWVRFSRFDVIMIMLTVVYLLISTLVNQGGLGSILTYFCSIFFLIVLSRATFTPKQKRILKFVCCAVVIALSLLSLIYINNYWGIYRSSRFLNPNTYSIFLLYAYALYICLSEKKISVWKVLLTVMTVFSIFNYRARAMVVAVLVFIFLQIFRTKKVSRGMRLLSALLVVVGLVLPFLYLLLYENEIDLIIMGKSLFTGREQMWARMIDMFKSDPIKILFGLGSKVKLGKDSLNVHNNLFVVIVNFGVIGFALYMIMLWNYIRKACANIMNRKAYTWYSMFVAAILVLGMSETVSFWAPSMVFAYLGLGMAANSTKDVKEACDDS